MSETRSVTVGEPLEISLEAVPTAGFSGPSPKGAPTSSSWSRATGARPAAASEARRSRCSGFARWHRERATLRFRYGRSWEGGGGEEREVTVVVTESADGSR